MEDGKPGKEKWSRKRELESYFALLLLVYPCTSFETQYILLNDDGKRPFWAKYFNYIIT